MGARLNAMQNGGDTNGISNTQGSNYRYPESFQARQDSYQRELSHTWQLRFVNSRRKVRNLQQGIESR